MTRVRVTSRVRMPEGVFEPGAEISVSEEGAADLFEIGVAEPVDEQASSTSTVEATLAAALEALRRATPDQVREFFRTMADDEEIAAKIDSEVSRQKKLIAAIAGLDPENRDHWIADGRPSTKAIEAATGLEEVSAAERDAAWVEFEKAKEED